MTDKENWKWGNVKKYIDSVEYIDEFVAPTGRGKLDKRFKIKPFSDRQQQDSKRSTISEKKKIV